MAVRQGVGIYKRTEKKVKVSFYDCYFYPPPVSETIMSTPSSTTTTPPETPADAPPATARTNIVNIKDPTGKTDDVVAHGVFANSLRCGHCLCPVMEGNLFVVLQSPYCCVLHSTCVGSFPYNGEGRMANTADETRALGEADYDDDDRLISRYLRNPVTARKVPVCIQEALLRSITRARLVNRWRREVFHVHSKAEIEKEKEQARAYVRELAGKNRKVLQLYDTEEDSNAVVVSQ
jgi:hypothetical protein